MKQLIDDVMDFPPIRFIADVAETYFTKRVSRSAAELAYFMILTFFPILICLSAFLDMLNLNPAVLVEGAGHFLPEGVVLIFEDYLGYIDSFLSTRMLLSGLFVAIVSASAAVRGLMNIMQEIYGRDTFRGLRQLLASILISVLLLAIVYLSMAVMVTGNWFFHLLGQLLELEDLVKRVGTWQWMKYLLLFLLVFLFILLLYRLAAPLDKPRPPVAPGAVGASIALAVASMIFSAFMSGSTRYSLVYGSLASMIIMLVWLYLCGNILVLGSVVNYVMYCHQRKKRGRTGAPDRSHGA